jgi:superfamily II DNA or RNA helicase
VSPIGDAPIQAPFTALALACLQVHRKETVMKLKILGLAAGATLLGLTATTASADTDIYVGVDLGLPVVVERRPVYDREYYEPAPVVYYEYREYPRTTYVYHEREVVHHHHRHDRGRHRGHYQHGR